MKKKKKNKAVISPASRQFIQAAWSAQTKKPWDFLHSYVYARWPYLYIGLGSGEHPITRKIKPVIRTISRLLQGNKPSSQKEPVSHNTTQATGTVADFYHGKVMPLEPVQRLVMVNEPINMPDLEQVIPYTKARAIIQQNPGHILLMQCPCRASKEDSCQPSDVCLVIGDPFVDFIHQHYPSRGRRISQEEACDLLAREDARGRVHHAFFSEMMLGRLFAICNCCACCCTAMKNQRMGIPMLASSGYISQIDGELCTACHDCLDRCQFDALGLERGRPVVNEEKCMGCGVCVGQCQAGAISLRVEVSKGTPLEIESLIAAKRENQSIEVSI